eukprot:gene34075-44028_t
MSLADYTNVDSKNNLLENGSIRNAVLIRSELFFVVSFAVEMFIKMFALGVYGSKSSYFSDKWNWLDCLIVVLSILSNISNSANIRILRTFRILRPLKSLRTLPGIAEITDVLLKSMPKMRDGFMIILFMIFSFARSWNANMASSITSVAAFEKYRCLNASNFDYVGQIPSYSKSSSPWNVPHPECYWPVDPNDFQQCSLVGNGNHVCQNGYSYSPNVTEWRWCGSGFDGTGNDRFGGNLTFLDTYYSSAGYGWINYDNFGFCFLQVIQIMSGDSWSIMEYQIFDSISVEAGALYFNVIVLVMTFFLVQIVVAILESTFAQKLDAERKVVKQKHALFSSSVKLLQHKGSHSFYSDHSEINESSKVEDSPPQSSFTTDSSSKGSANHKPELSFSELRHRNDGEIGSLRLGEYNPNDSAPGSPLGDGSVSELSPSRERLLGGSTMPSQRDIPKAPALTRSPSYKSAQSSEPDSIVKEPNYLERISAFIDKYDQPDKVYLRRCVKSLVQSIPFRAFFVFLILLNTAFFSVDHYPIDNTTANLIDIVSFLLTVLFALEEFLILFGRGVKYPFRDGLSFLDFAIVIISVVDISVTPLPNALTNRPLSSPMMSGDSSGSFAALRAFRLLRLLQLIQSKSFRGVFDKILKVASKLANYLVVFILLNVILGLLGMQFFSNRFRFDSNGFVITEINSPEWIAAPDRPRSNFDNFTLALLAVFQCITVDNWSTVMFDTYRAFGPVSILFPIFCFLFGSIVLMNLFLALLIRCFHEDQDDSAKETEDTNLEEDRYEELVDVIDCLLCFCSSLVSSSYKYCQGVWTNTIECVHDVYIHCVWRIPTTSSVVGESSPNVKFLSYRAKMVKVLDHKVFEVCMLSIICLSCVQLALDSPLVDPSSTKALALFALDIFIVIAFGIEMVLKMLASGAFGESSYFSDKWNLLDGFVVFVSVLNVVLQRSNAAAVGSLRILRIVRPLRLIRKVSSLQVVVVALITSATEIMNVFIFTFLVFFIFAAFFTCYLKGQLRACDGIVFQTVISPSSTYLNLLTYPQSWQDMSAQDQMLFGPSSPFFQQNFSSSAYPLQCNSLGNCCPNWSQLDVSVAPTSRQICECWGAGWYPTTDFRFDNVAMSLVTLFNDATIDNWTDNMHAVSDSTGIDMQPVRDNLLYWCYIFFAFIVLSNFFCLNLFIGTITSKFLAARRRLGGFTAMTEEQEKWALTLKIIRAIQPKRKLQCPENKILALFFRIAESTTFMNIMYVCILFQCVALSMQSFGQPDETTVWLRNVEVSLGVLFTVEMIIKMCGLTCVVYFQDWWNRADFVIVCCSVASLLQYAITGDMTGLVITALRLIRVFRIFRILKRLKMFQNLLDAIFLTIPSILNVSLLLFMVIFMFSIVCMQLFAKVAYNGSYFENANFRSFGISFVTLFRMLTGDNWGQLMYDISKNTPGCVYDPPYNSAYCGFNDAPGCVPLNGCGSVAAFPIIILFMIITTLVILSVYISVIISNYSSLTTVPIHPQHFDTFAEYWADFDPDATCYIDYAMLYPLVFILPPPLGFNRQVFSRRQYARRVGDIKVTKDRKVFFSDVLNILSRSYFHRSFVNRTTDFHVVHRSKEKKKSTTWSPRWLVSPTVPRASGGRNLHLETEGESTTTVSTVLAAEMIAEVWSLRKKCLRGYRNGALGSNTPMSKNIRTLLRRSHKENHQDMITMNEGVVNAIQRAEQRAYAHQLAKDSNSIRIVVQHLAQAVSSKVRNGYSVIRQRSSGSDLGNRSSSDDNNNGSSHHSYHQDDGRDIELNQFSRSSDKDTEDSILNNEFLLSAGRLSLKTGS